jgi:TonB-dependent SusC/RagA subfamily outer membrane receptor
MNASLLLSWLAVSAVMSAFIAVAALLTQQVVGRAAPSRLVWVVALLAAGAVTATQPFRRTAPPSATLPQGVSIANVPGAVTALPALGRLALLLDAPAQAVHALATAARDAGARLSPPVHRALLLTWPIATAGIGLVLLLSYRRQRALLDRADRLELAGTPVHVSGNTGPVVIGALAPAIVVPAWLLERSEEEQQLVVAHEAAHIAAHDPQLLLAGCALVVLMPWNLAAWFMLNRLRLAIELDCDARVLARGTNTRRYGQLLIELSAAMPRPAIPVGTPAFSYRPSHLERRLRTMTARPTRFRAARRASAMLIGSAAVLAACGAELPTAAELQGMDVAKAESRIGQVITLDSANTVYVVNGVKVSEIKAKSIGADSIATINVSKVGNMREIRIVTKEGPMKVVAGRPLEERKVTGFALRSDSASAPGDVAIRMRATNVTGADPLFYIDGKKSTKADMDKLAPTAIESVSVLKGPAAVAKYGQDAANGVIEIVLKK